MLDPRVVITVFCLYMGLLFLIALWVERKSATGRSPAHNPIVYSLSLAVYCTAWTYYGSVGLAANSGLLFLTIYLGPTITFFLWWTVLRKLVRLKNTHRITSIADFISARYNKSQPLAAIATVIALVGVMPYITLQLKAIISTFGIITFTGAPTSWIGRHVGPIVVALMVVFTIIMGVRRLDPTERHEGIVMALAVECLVKLVAFLAVGIFVTYFMYDGFSDIFQRLSESPFHNLTRFGGENGSSYFTWTTYLVLSMSAILFLPRQFHVAVVENYDEKHILTAKWFFPLYMLLINLFVFPIAVGGLLQGHAIHQADTFVLTLPLLHGGPWLTLLVFIGGFSAATGMIMISSMTMATMITNHLLLPLVGWFRWLNFLKHHLLRCRWVAVAGFILMGYWFERRIGESYILVNIGLISFAAVLQFAPAILGAIFWRRGNKAGAILGLSAGFMIWGYTLLIPSFVKSGWISSALLEKGPWGIEFLRPEQLLGLGGIDPLSHTVFWSMFFNIGLYVLGSLYFEGSESEHSLAEEFVGSLATTTTFRPAVPREAYIDLAVKRKEMQNLLSQYFSEPEATAMVERSLRTAAIEGKKRISIVDLVELHSEVEKSLAGSIGAAAAHQAVSQGIIFIPREARELSEVYAEILADLKVTPTELKRRIDYSQEREKLLTRQATELEEKVKEREREIAVRKRAEEALRKSEKRFRDISYSMADWIWEVDKDGIYTFASGTVKQILGYDPEEVIGKTPFQLMPENEAKRVEEVFKKIASDKKPIVELENWNLTKEGKPVCLLTNAVPLLNESGELIGYRGVDKDITERKWAEEALRDSEERYRSLIENIDLGITLIDANYKIVMTNTAQGSLFRKPVSEFVDRQCYKEFAKNEMVCPFCPGTRAMASGQAEDVETEGVRDDGSRFPVRLQVFPLRRPDGSISGFIEVMEDITERKLAEKERVRLATAIEQAAGSIIITQNDGTIQYVNPAFERISGYSREEAIGKNPRILKSGKQDKAFYKEMWDTLTRGEVWTGHFINKKKDGGLYECDTTISPIRDESGAIINYVFVGRDVTHIVRLEKQLRQAQKMEAIGTLAGGIAHDFNNILTVIIGYAEILLDGVSGDDSMRVDLEEVLKAGFRARGLVEQILTFSRQTEQERRPLQIAPIVKETLKLLRASIPKTVEIRENIAPESGMVLADPTQILQVLMNLCTNSAHAMRERGGRLEVGLMDVDLDYETVAQYPDLSPGPYSRLTVSDTGHGMDRTVKERIFDPFFTTKGPGEGTGLGLATVYGIVKSHRGEITVYSEPGKGTTFHVFLPKVEVELIPSTEPLVPLSQGKERILFVDDEEAVVQIGRKMLERLGYEVITSTDGSEALEIFRSQPEQFDLVITDQTMPNITGAELAQELMRIQPDIPVILCSGFSELMDQEKAKAIGIREFVMKPIITRDIGETIRKVLEGEKS